MFVPIQLANLSEHRCFWDRLLAQNTYTNAEKLLAAAEELARSGECDPEEVLSVARELEAHVAAFAARVDRRRRRLDLAVLLYTHEKEVSRIPHLLLSDRFTLCPIAVVLTAPELINY